MRILIDIDSTIAETLDHWVAAINRDYGTHATVSDIKEWVVSKAEPFKNIHPKRIFDYLDDEKFMSSIPPVNGAATGVLRLINAGHEVYLVTARMTKGAMDITKEWLKRHFPFIDHKTQVIYCPDKTLIPADAIVDDKPQTLMAYRQKRPLALCMGLKYAYNEHLHGTNGINPAGNPIVIVGDSAPHLANDWGEIVGRILALKEGE